MSKLRVAVFDAYGTLLDVHAAMQLHAARIGPAWARISQDWRNKHLEYTWVRSLAGQHRDFWLLAEDSLAVVAAQHGITDPALLDDILHAYRELAAYPEVPAMLERLRQMGIGCAILSNGTPEMLRAAVRAGHIDHLLDDVLSVESVGVYKPDPRVYALVTARFACTPGEVVFLSSNPWDAFGAHVFGFRVFRVNRGGQPNEYGLRPAVAELANLTGLPDALA